MSWRRQIEIADHTVEKVAHLALRFAIGEVIVARCRWIHAPVESLAQVPRQGESTVESSGVDVARDRSQRCERELATSRVFPQSGRQRLEERDARTGEDFELESVLRSAGLASVEARDKCVVSAWRQLRDDDLRVVQARAFF